MNLLAGENPQRRALYAFLIGTLAVGASASFFTEPNIAAIASAIADIVVIAPCVQMVQGTDQTIIDKIVDLLLASQQRCCVAPKSRDA